MSFIDILFHANFGILKFLMHELSKKPGKIVRHASSLMHELFYFSRKMSPNTNSLMHELFPSHAK